MKEALLIIDKPVGPTSFDVVREVKRTLPGAKVGHTGSLDPFASGVLILLLGKATKLSNALLNADKSYRAVVKLGESTDTMDRTGKVTETAPVPAISQEEIIANLKSFEGEWLQTPPMYSAKKIHGVRLYELARQNINVRRLPIPVQLYKLDFLEMGLPYVTFEVHCSKGTYIRSLADDIGKRLGTVGHLAELRRLTCGEFALGEAITLEALKANPAQCLEQGYWNYVRLLRTEGLARGGNQGRTAEAHSHLQMPTNSGNSLLN
jgi:tRNA pseudouridine55 synthase